MSSRQRLSPRVIVDDRWAGPHGIGRYATEVLSRLTAKTESIAMAGNPTSVRGITSYKRLTLSSRDVLYSPGFNVSLTRARQLITLHDLIHVIHSKKVSATTRVYFNVFARWVVKRCGVVLTVSHASAREIETWLGSSSVDIVVAGCGRSAAFTPEGRHRQFSRPTFVFVSGIRPHKNVAKLLDACVMRPEYDLVIVTPDTVAAAELVAERGLQERVSVESGRSDEDLAALYRGSVGAVVPSLVEGFGLPALEAMSCGARVAHWRECASVAEICGSTSVVVEDAHLGASWADALDRLIKLGPLASHELSDDWWTKYSWESVAAIVNATIVRVLTKNPAAS